MINHFGIFKRVFSAGADHSDNPYGMGLAHYLYWPTFFKRNGIKFWLIFLEKFGMPTAAAKLPPGQAQDPMEREKALQALDAIQSDSGVVIPDNVIIELIEAARSLSDLPLTYCEKPEFGHFLCCFSLNRTTIRLKSA